MDLGRQGGGKTPDQLLLPLLRELGRKVYCARHVRYNNIANMLHLSSQPYLSIHRWEIERHESQWKDSKDKLEFVYCAWGCNPSADVRKVGKQKLTIVLLNSIALLISSDSVLQLKTLLYLHSHKNKTLTTHTAQAVNHPRKDVVHRCFFKP